MNYKLKGDVILRKRICKFKQDIDIIARQKNKDVLTLDGRIFNFLQNLDGLHSVNDLKQIFRKVYNQKLNIKLFSNNKLLGRIITKGNDVIDKNQIVMVNGLVASCRLAIWHLTDVCNLSCQHCYYDYVNSKKRPFTRKEIDNIIDNLWALGVEKVVLSGGAQSPLVVAFVGYAKYLAGSLNAFAMLLSTCRYPLNLCSLSYLVLAILCLVNS